MSRTLLRPVFNARAALVRPISSLRSLHTTIPRLASEAPTDPLADPKFQNFYEKIRNHQGAVDAMMKVGEVMKSKGASLSSLRPNTKSFTQLRGAGRSIKEADLGVGLDTSKPPSKMEMVKLSFDKDLRDAATNVSHIYARIALSSFGRISPRFSL